MKRETVIKVENVKKKYRLGAIGGGTLQADLQSWWARLRGKEDPNTKIGQEVYDTGEIFYALKGINFEVYKGERLGIIGGNGAGKSTTLKLLSRVTGPTEGNIYIKGRISSMLEVGTGFHPELTGRENIYLNGAILGMSKAEVDSKIEDIIEFSECRQFIDTPVKRYSSGMYVKLAFAVAAHLDSEILVMDEVLAVGDMKFQQKCLGKMSDVAESEGRTVLYVSHNMNTIRQLCDRCIVLDHGRVIFDGDVEEAISLYLGNEVVNEIAMNYDNYQRPDWLRNNDLRIKKVSFKDKDTNVFIDDEKLILDIRWHNNSDIDGLCIRWEIRNNEGSPIGISNIYNIYEGKKDKDGSITLEYDISLLSKGSYSTFVTFYYCDDYGNYVNLDCVPSLSFSKDFINKKVLVWDSKNWGNIEFNSPLIIS